MTKDEGMTNSEVRNRLVTFVIGYSDIPSAFDIRTSSFLFVSK